MQNDPTHSHPFGYAAFISYRHLPQDTKVACEVQRTIENYRLPPHISQITASANVEPYSRNSSKKQPASLLSSKLGKCFRDEDELAASHSLPDSIQKALAASHTLIVICSPETQNSP